MSAFIFGGGGGNISSGFQSMQIFFVVKFSFTNAGTSQTSTRQAEIVLHHTMQRLSLLCFPPYFLAGRSLCLWDYKAVKRVTKRCCPSVQRFKKCKPSVEPCLSSDPPSSPTTEAPNPAVLLHHELAIKELTKL